jgi:hypothetical protein
VRGQEDGFAGLLLRANQLLDPARVDRVLSGGRLVEEEQLRIVQRSSAFVCVQCPYIRTVTVG